MTLRRIVGGVLVCLGTAGLFTTLEVLMWQARASQRWDIGLWITTFGVPLLTSAVVLGVGVGILLRRLRGLSALLCVSGFVVSTALLVLAIRPLERLAVLPVAAIFGYALIYLLWPERNDDRPPPSTVEQPAAGKDDGWRTWLLASLADASPERAPDRFVETALVCVLLVGTSLGVYVVGSSLPQPDNETMQLVVISGWALFWFIVALPFLTRLRRLLRQAKARSAERELLAGDARRPVLFLRSFELDGDTARPARGGIFATLLGPKRTQEEVLAKELRRCGPLIAIGRPDERLPELGAARFYTSDDRWQQKIADVVRVAELVVWTTGTTKGLTWELTHLLSSLPPERLIVWAHPHLLALDAEAREARWRGFLSALGRLFPKPMPTSLGDTRFFHFGPDYQPYPAAPAARWRWLTNPHRSALRSLFAAKGLPHERAMIRKRRRQTLAVAGAFAASLVLPAAAVFILSQRRPQWRDVPITSPALPRPLESLTSLLAITDDERLPSSTLAELEAMLLWTEEDWHEQVQASAYDIDRLRPLLTRYVRIFQLAQHMPEVEALLYGSGLPLYVDIRDAADAAARLSKLTSVMDAITEFLAVLEKARMHSPDQMDEEFKRRLDARAHLLQSEAAILHLLAGNTAWQMVKSDTVTVPEFSDADLQNQLVDLAEDRDSSLARLQDLLDRAPAR